MKEREEDGKRGGGKGLTRRKEGGTKAGKNDLGKGKKEKKTLKTNKQTNKQTSKNLETNNQ